MKQIVIEIPEGTKLAIDMGTINQVLISKVWDAIKNSTPLPEYHGRLIDADELKKQAVFMDTARLINNAPTILDATMGYKMLNYCCTNPMKEGE